MIMILSIDKKTIRVEVNASTLIIYEDRFKGRRLLRDLYGVTEMLKNAGEIPFSLITKLLWAAVKTADDSTDDIYAFIKQFTISDVVGVSVKIIELYTENIELRKKASATVRLGRLCRRLKFWRSRSNAV